MKIQNTLREAKATKFKKRVMTIVQTRFIASLTNDK